MEHSIIIDYIAGLEVNLSKDNYYYAELLIGQLMEESKSNEELEGFLLRFIENNGSKVEYNSETTKGLKIEEGE